MSQAEFRVDDTALAEAEAALAALAEEYPAYALVDVADMKRLTDAILMDAQNGAGLSRDLAALYGIAHNVKGQGASFGYDLMTIFGEALCQQLRHLNAIDASGARRLASLVNACEMVLTERLTGKGGRRGCHLLAESGLAVS